MQTINIHEAKTHLSRLIEDAAHGNAFIIAKAGKPLVKVVPLAADDYPDTSRLGFMSGEIGVPDDFDTIESAHLAALFEGGLA